MSHTDEAPDSGALRETDDGRDVSLQNLQALQDQAAAQVALIRTTGGDPVVSESLL